MRNQLHIVKIGGKVLEDQAQFSQFLPYFSQIKTNKILVHGGGKKADQLCHKLGITPIMHAGRRITDEETLDVVTMVYAGLLNKKLVSSLQSIQCNAIGLSGADGNAILAKKRPVTDIDWGFAGDIKTINVPVISALLQAKLVPVFCAITHDLDGQLLNTNADTIAAQLAIALSEHYSVRLNYCFEKPGVLLDPQKDDSAIASLDYVSYQDFLKRGIISGGMQPKLDNAFQTLSQGVEEINIGNIYALENDLATKLSRLPIND